MSDPGWILWGTAAVLIVITVSVSIRVVWRLRHQPDDPAERLLAAKKSFRLQSWAFGVALAAFVLVNVARVMLQ